MTTAVAHARTAQRRLAVSSDVLAVAGLTLLSAFLVALTWGTWGDLGNDTGYDVLAGTRLAEGELPYVDYTYYYGPLAPAVLGFAALIGGPGIGPAVAVGILVAVAIVMATFALGRLLMGPLGAFLAAAIAASVAFAPTNFSFVMPHTFSATLGLLALLAFLLAVGRFSAGEDRRWLVGAGAGVGALALIRPEFEPAALLAAAVWLALRWRAGSSRLRDVALFALPAVLVPAAVYGAFLLGVSPHVLLFENLYPVDELQAAGNTLLKSQAPLTFSSIAELGAKVVLYGGGALALVVLARMLEGRGAVRRGAVVLAALAPLVAGAVSLANPEALRHGLQFVYGWIPAGAVLALLVLLVRFRRRDGAWTAQSQLALVACAVLAVLAAKTYVGFFAYGPTPQKAVYAIPLAALLLGRLHLVELGRSRSARTVGAAWLAFLALAGAGLTLNDSRRESVAVSGPGGSIAERPDEAVVYQGALDWIAANTADDEPVLLGPQMTALYTLSERSNPLEQLSLLPGALPSPADEAAAIRRLDAADVGVLVLDRRTFPEYGHGAFGQSFDRRLAAWIREHFTLATTLSAGDDRRTLDIWTRRTS